MPIYEVFAVTAVAAGASLGTAAAIGTATVGVVEAGVSLYGSQESAAAQRNAASSNAYVSKMAATAQAQSAMYSDELNYQTAMVQSQESAYNASILHNAARLTEKEGTAQIQDLDLQQKQANSATIAAYGASGVTEDSGSPALVQAHNAGRQMMATLDTQFKFNTQAADQDWQGELQSYQSKLTAATAQQYQYAKQMAEWQESAGIAGANIQQTNADNSANAMQIAGYAGAISSLGSTINSGINTYTKMA